MKQLLDRTERALNRFSSALAFLSVISLFLLMAVVTLGVIMRYGFNNALSWSDEVASYSLLAIVFFGMAHTFHQGGHIRIDFVFNSVPPRVKPWLNLFLHVIGLLFALAMILAVYTRIENFWVRNTRSFTDLYTPLYIPALPLMIGSVLLFLVLLAQVLRILVQIGTGDAASGQPEFRSE